MLTFCFAFPHHSMQICFLSVPYAHSVVRRHVCFLYCIPTLDCCVGTGGGGAALDGALVAHHLGRVLPFLFLILYPTSDSVLAVALGRHSDRSVIKGDRPVMYIDMAGLSI